MSRTARLLVLIAGMLASSGPLYAQGVFGNAPRTPRGKIGLTGSVGSAAQFGAGANGLGGMGGFPGAMGGAGGFGGAPAPAATPAPEPEPDLFHYEDLVQLIEEWKPKRLEDLLPKLPGDMLKNFVLMRRSKSNHIANGDYPRVILCSPQGRLIMAYSTALSDPNRHVLELIQWREKPEQFEFREVAFDPNGKALPKLSEANPLRCAGCHGQDSLRPNWEPASIWPGAIGEELTWTQPEIRRLEQLARRNDVRLASLSWDLPQESTKTASHRMSEHVNELNMRRMVNLLRESPDYETYKFAIVASLIGSPDLIKVEPIRSEYEEDPTEFDSRLKETRKTMTQMFPQYYRPDDAQAIAGLRQVFETRNISLREMGTSLRSNFVISGKIETDFVPVVNALYARDLELREAAPLGANTVHVFQRGKNQADLVQALAKAAAAKKRLKETAHGR